MPRKKTAQAPQWRLDASTPESLLRSMQDAVDPRHSHLFETAGVEIEMANVYRELELADTHVAVNRADRKLRCLRHLAELAKTRVELQKLETLESRMDEMDRALGHKQSASLRADQAPAPPVRARAPQPH